MRRSITPGKLLPESWEEFCGLIEANGQCMTIRCPDCRAPFGPDNTRTAAGWRETQLSGLCETCYDGLFAEGEPA